MICYVIYYQDRYYVYPPNYENIKRITTPHHIFLVRIKNNINLIPGTFTDFEKSNFLNILI